MKIPIEGFLPLYQIRRNLRKTNRGWKIISCGKPKKEFCCLNDNISRFLTEPIHHGIRAVLQGDFSNLPEDPSDEDWQILALMIEGYSLSKQLGLGELGGFLTKQCLPQYLKTGLLPEKSIELWMFLFGMQ